MWSYFLSFFPDSQPLPVLVGLHKDVDMYVLYVAFYDVQCCQQKYCFHNLFVRLTVFSIRHLSNYLMHFISFLEISDRWFINILDSFLLKKTIILL